MNILEKISAKIGKKTKQKLKKWGEYCWYTVIAGVILLGLILVGRPAVSLAFTKHKISALNREKRLYLDSIHRDSMLIENLKNDEFLERYAREKYFMQGKGEQVFIVE